MAGIEWNAVKAIRASVIREKMSYQIQGSHDKTPFSCGDVYEKEKKCVWKAVEEEKKNGNEKKLS